MKKLAILLLMFLFQFTLVNAQGRFSPKERAKDLKDKLELTEDQAKKVEAIYEESTVKAKEIRDNSAGSRAEMIKAMKPLNDETNKKIENLLDDKQKEAFTKLLKERQEMRSKRNKPQD